ncbi:TetR/AcrR family transcriptional regulator [Saccharopolyspora sp. NPDC050642]|uniref:TetR/AcrR family transcriptional regulator n=1 Tax=Saccharopolyspora sp. NPDC050642 TaxID=3157099 RepID=UPI0033C3EB83
MHRDVLRAASELLDERGYSRLTMEAVAHRAKVGKATVYRWWSSKSALALEVLAERYQSHPVPDSGDSRQDLVAFLSVNIVEQLRQVDRATALALSADVADDPEARRIWVDLGVTRRRLGRAVVGRVIARGDLPEDTDVDLVLDMFAGFTFFRRNLTDRPIGVQYAEQLVDLLLGGQVPRRTAQRATGPPED